MGVDTGVAPVPIAEDGTSVSFGLALFGKKPVGLIVGADVPCVGLGTTSNEGV